MSSRAPNPGSPVVVGWPAEGSIGDAVAAAAAACPGADLAIVEAPDSLPEAWLGLLSRAANSDDTIALATAWPGRPASGTPRVSVPNPACTLLRRSAFDLLGGLEPGLTDPRAALPDFAARARQLGLSCVLADGLALPDRPDPLPPCPEDEQDRLDAGPLKRALIAGRAARTGLSVTIDARALGSGVGGTQTYVAGLVLALSRSERVRVRAVLGAELEAGLRAALADAGIELSSYAAAAAGELPPTDIVHRPQQVFTPADLALLALLGERLVVSHLDLIAYRAPTYHPSAAEWAGFRRTTRLALAAADSVVFFSEHARDDALAEDLVPADRAHVAGIGVLPSTAAGTRPSRIPDGREFILMLGADYAHKNRPFALELVDELRASHGFGGLLVLAGAHVPQGGSAPVAGLDGVIDLGLVPEAEKVWLAAHAVAHMTSSVYEGFGLAPLEAAVARKPCIYAAVTSLREIVDPAAATIVPWDAEASAAAAAALLVPGPARDRHLQLLQESVDRYSWDRVIPEILDAYERAIRSPFRAAAPRAWAELEREQHMAELGRAYEQLDARTQDGRPLIDAGDPLLTPAQQRGLMRVASRHWLRAPLLGPFGLLGSARRRDAAP